MQIIVLKKLSPSCKTAFDVLQFNELVPKIAEIISLFK